MTYSIIKLMMQKPSRPTMDPPCICDRTAPAVASAGLEVVALGAAPLVVDSVEEGTRVVSADSEGDVEEVTVTATSEEGEVEAAEGVESEAAEAEDCCEAIEVETSSVAGAEVSIVKTEPV